MTHDKVAYCRDMAWISQRMLAVIISKTSLPTEVNSPQECRPLVTLRHRDLQRSAIRLDWRNPWRCFPLLDDTTIYWMPVSVNSSSEWREIHHSTPTSTSFAACDRVYHRTQYGHRLSDDDLDGDMIADGVSIPRDVWTWGIQNRTGTSHDL